MNRCHRKLFYCQMFLLAEFIFATVASLTIVLHRFQKQSSKIVDHANPYLYARPLSLWDSGVQIWFRIPVIAAMSFPELRPQWKIPHNTAGRDSCRVPDSMANITALNFSLNWPPKSRIFSPWIPALFIRCNSGSVPHITLILSGPLFIFANISAQLNFVVAFFSLFAYSSWFSFPSLLESGQLPVPGIFSLVSQNCPYHTGCVIDSCGEAVVFIRHLVNSDELRRRRWRSHTHISMLHDVSRHPSFVCLFHFSFLWLVYTKPQWSWHVHLSISERGKNGPLKSGVNSALRRKLGSGGETMESIYMGSTIPLLGKI